MGVGNDPGQAIARTPVAGQTIVHEFLAPVNDTYWVQMQSSSTPAAGTIVSIRDTSPASNSYNLTIVEILPAP